MSKKNLLTSMVVGVALATGSAVSHADAVATAYLNVFDFAWYKANTDTKLVLGTDIFFIQGVNNNGDTVATLNGITDDHTATAPAGPAGLDVEFSCVPIGAGYCASYVENSFAQTTKPSTASATYAMGDALLTGAIVDIGQPTPDANAETLAEVAMLGPTNDGTSPGNNVGVQGNFGFVSAITGGVDISFLADAYTRGRLSAEEVGTNADANVTWSINILEIDPTGGTTTALSYAPSEINGTSNRSATVPGDDFEYILDDFAGFANFSVNTGNRYQVTIAHASNANAILVPAPATVALLGLGLLGMGAARRRKARI